MMLTYMRQIVKALSLITVLCWAVIITGSNAGSSPSKGINVNLRAKWPAAPILLEAYEFVAQEAPARQAEFLNAWASPEGHDTETCWDDIISSTHNLLSSTQQKVLPVILNIRLSSARLEFFRSLAQTVQTPEVQGACNFVDIGGELITGVEGRSRALKALEGAEQIGGQGIQLFETDHVLAPEGMTVATLLARQKANRTAIAVLYGAPGTPGFKELHGELMQYTSAGQGQLAYVYRPALLSSCQRVEGTCLELGTSEALQLPGFGVELAIKNMEYSAMDDSKVAAEQEAARDAGEEDEGPLEVEGFLFKRLLERKPEKRQELLTLRDHLLASSSASDTLKVWNMKDFGLQATQRITASSDPLRALTEMAQNFPNLAAALSRVAVPNALRNELRQSQGVVQGGASVLIVNGMLMDLQNFDLYSLVDTIRKEVSITDMLGQTGLQQQDIIDLLALRSQLGEVDVDDMKIDIRSDEHILWANNIETDNAYWSWQRSLSSLLRPMFPGQMHPIQRNLLNLVAIIDPGTLEGLRVARLLMDITSKLMPVRCGLLLVPSAAVDRLALQGLEGAQTTSWAELAPSEKAAVAYTFIHEEDPLLALKFLARIMASFGGSKGYDGGAELNWQAAEQAFKQTWGELDAAEMSPGEALDKLSSEGAQPREAMFAAAQFARSRGVAGLGQAAAWLNGLLIAPDAGITWQQQLQFNLQVEQQRLQEMVYYQTIDDDDEDLLAAILSASDAAPKYNPELLKGASDQQMALVSEMLKPTTEPWSLLGYLHRPGTEDKVKGISHWVVTDLDTEEGRALAVAALGHLQTEASEACRIALIHSPQGFQRGDASLQVRASLAASRLQSRRPKIGAFLGMLLRPGTGLVEEEEILKLAAEAGLNEKAFAEGLQSTDIASLASSLAAACRSGLGLAAGEPAIVTNGRVTRLEGLEPLLAEDFRLLDQYANTAQVAKQVADVVLRVVDEGRAVHTPRAGADDDDLAEEWSPEELSSAALLASSVLAKHGTGQTAGGRGAKLLQAVKLLSPRLTNITIAGTGVPVEVLAILDPLSKTAQRVAPVLDFLQKTLGIPLKVFLNPPMELADMPLKSFYRYSLPDTTGDLPGVPSASFSGLPSQKILTLNMDVPEAWLVEPVKAELDLDNLRLADLGQKRRMTADFELESLILSGSCIDVAATDRAQVTPRGVQLVLGTEQEPAMVDTVVMAIMGYFQLKARPGALALRLAQGRSQMLYAVDNSTAGVAPQGPDGEEPTQALVAIDSLGGRHMQLYLHKRPGFEREDVLGGDLDEREGSVWGKMSSWLGMSPAARRDAGANLTAEEDPECVHIFTVASGLMYERLQKIMVLSVLRNTKNRVKFWFIKNYMSPQMKRFLPLMAEHYGFEYEFVTYKWPTWLHKQTEKQRIIWAYKILFLDVLFPLSLRKVIFMDSDQIIRADVAELWHMDIEGAPLAYTPFCDNNKEMDGFRFWKQGFWKDHLRGHPYHISALYVVDLARFRQMAAGDQLRVVYDQLSRDPASLSNLDQDLPNYAQHQVPIFSLPQEWLWCETWCGNATKKFAKTIDLCNNPLTKEPKLEGARRIVKEWPGLDEEVATFTAQMEALLAKDSGDMWIAAASQDAQVELQNADKASLQGGEGEGESSSSEHRDQQHHHDSSEL